MGGAWTESRDPAEQLCPGVRHLVLQPVAAALQVHLLGVGVVEAALAQLAVEADDFALVVAHLQQEGRRHRGEDHPLIPWRVRVATVQCTQQPNGGVGGTVGHSGRRCS